MMLLLGRRQFDELLFFGHLADVLGDLHRAVLRAAHAAEVGALERVLRQRFVVITLRRFRIERQAELLVPIEFEASLAKVRRRDPAHPCDRERHRPRGPRSCRRSRLA